MPQSKKPRLFQTKQPIVFGEHLTANLESRSDVNVVFTTWAGTQAALKMAGQWTQYLEARIVVWFLEVVPRQFALRRPPSSVEFTERRLTKLATSCCDGVDVEIRLCLCTNFSQCLVANLKPDSMVFMGGRTRIWRTWERKLAEFLKVQGHVVLFVDTKKDRLTELLVSDRVPA
jgi:hypothetical protein